MPPSGERVQTRTGWLDKLGLSPSFALCDKAKFDYLQFPKYSGLYKM